MAQYSYDETGDIFNYFCLTLLALVLTPLTYWHLLQSGGSRSMFEAHQQQGVCGCPACVDRRQKIKALKAKKNGKGNKGEGSSSLISWRSLGLAAGWAFFAYVLMLAATSAREEKGIWDPYEILGISSSADNATIRKAFKKLSLQYHPDKVAPDEKAAAELKFVEISKAHKVLTNDEARKVFDETGHPDGRQAFQLGLALPKWLVEEKNSSLVLLVYALAFGIGLPIAVARWWGRAKNKTKNNVLQESMALFYKELRDNSSFKSLVDLISRAEEFKNLISLSSNADLADLQEAVRSAMEKKTSDRFNDGRLAKRGSVPKDPSAALAGKVSLLLYSHLLRVPIKDPLFEMERDLVVEKAFILTAGLIQIAAPRAWLNALIAAMDLGQLFVQALYLHQSNLLQLPYLDNPDLLKHFKTKKRNITSLAEFRRLSEDDQSSLLQSLSPENLSTIRQVISLYPNIRIAKANFVVLGEPCVFPGAIVSLFVKLDKFPKQEGEESETELLTEETELPKWWQGGKTMTPAHAPYFPIEKEAKWWVIMGDPKGSRFVCFNKTPDFSETVVTKLQFQAPPNAGTWEFRIIVKSDSFVGCDVYQDIKLVVAPSEEAPLIEEEDDISEPGEDTLSGQLEAIRKSKVKGEYDDSSDSEVDGAVDRADEDHESSDDEPFVE